MDIIEKEDLISVIITTYGRTKFLEKAIMSVMSQSYKKFEIIVIDDNGSNIKNRNIVQEIIDKYKNIIYIKNEKNMGACYSRNIGIKKAKGKYIAFLDDDDEFYKDKLEKQIFKLKVLKLKNEKIGVISCRMTIKNQNKKIGVSKYNLLKENNNLKDFLEGIYITGTSSLLIEKKILLEIDGFSEIESCQEALLILKILEKGYEFTSIKEELVLYRKHNVGNIGKSSKAIIGQEKYLEKIADSIEKNISKKDQKIAKMNYNYSLFLFQLEKDKKQALKVFYKICKKNILSKITLKCLYRLVLTKKE